MCVHGATSHPLQVITLDVRSKIFILYSKWRGTLRPKTSMARDFLSRSMSHSDRNKNLLYL